jgi:hypothetical protein
MSVFLALVYKPFKAFGHHVGGDLWRRRGLFLVGCKGVVVGLNFSSLERRLKGGVAEPGSGAWEGGGAANGDSDCKIGRSTLHLNEEVGASDAELGVKNGAVVGEDVNTGQSSHGLNSASDSGTFSHGPSIPEIGDLVGTDGDLGADSVPYDGEFLLDGLLKFTGANVEKTRGKDERQKELC